MSVGISFLYQFDLGNRNVNTPGANILSVTETATGDFDKANLTTESLRQVWRSVNATGWKEIVIQADVTSRIDTFAILGHNLSSAAVVEVQANFSNNFLAPPATFLATWNEDDIVLCQDFGANYTYYKVRILDPANPCGFIQIGRIVGGRAFTFINNETVTDEISLATNDMADTTDTEGFFSVSVARVQQRKLTVKFSGLYTQINTDIQNANANYLGLVSLFKFVGITKPFLTIVDRADPYFQLLWGQMPAIPSFAYTVNRLASIDTMEIDEKF